MKPSIIAACVLMSLASAASAEDFWLLFQNQRVTLVARDMSVPKILEQWARIGGTTIVNGNAIQSERVTLQLIDVPEREALEILLRSTRGYIVAEHAAVAEHTSTIESILILPGSAPSVRDMSVASAPAPVAVERVDTTSPEPFVPVVSDTPSVPATAAARAVGASGSARPGTFGPSVPNIPAPPVVGGLGVNGPPPPGTFVAPNPDQPGGLMLYRPGNGGTGRPGETAAPIPVTPLSQGPQPRTNE